MGRKRLWGWDGFVLVCLLLLLLWSGVGGLGSALSPSEGAEGSAAGTLTPASANAQSHTGLTCEQMREGEPVQVVAEGAKGVTRRALGYQLPGTDQLLLPAQQLAAAFVESPVGVIWERESRTGTLLGPVEVLSVHFPAGEEQARHGILSGERIPLQAVLCGDQFYLELARFRSLLQLQSSWEKDGSLRLLPAR